VDSNHRRYRRRHCGVTNKMTPEDAIEMARSWTKGLKEEGIGQRMPIWHMVKALLDHNERQAKDVKELTLACQLLLRENNRLVRLTKDQGTRARRAPRKAA